MWSTDGGLSSDLGTPPVASCANLAARMGVKVYVPVNLDRPVGLSRAIRALGDVASAEAVSCVTENGPAGGVQPHGSARSIEASGPCPTAR